LGGRNFPSFTGKRDRHRKMLLLAVSVPFFL
jgi:hypothetical protein